jgi:hypothetical protein
MIWDTGASFGLTSFRQDFINYTECNIPVNDIARTNTVIGIGEWCGHFLAMSLLSSAISRCEVV